MDDRITEWKGLDSLEPFMANCSSCAHCGIVDSGNRKCLEAGNRIAVLLGLSLKKTNALLFFISALLTAGPFRLLEQLALLV